MKEDKKRRTISFTVDNADYEEILEYARIKGHGGQFPVSIFAHYAIRQMMKKYPVREMEKAEYRKRYQKDNNPLQAVQPDKTGGEK
jgi:hypothetical protein